MTLDEMAKELGVSKSTVSRALSGKGRIGAQTRQAVMELAAQNGMHQEKENKEYSDNATKTLGVVLPTDVYINVNPYFQECVLGICEAASMMDYHVLLTVGSGEDLTEVYRLVEERKVDGMILTRNLEEDKLLEYLTGIHFPVGITGTYASEEVIQVDADSNAAAESLTSMLIGKGFRKFGLLIEDFSYHVNRNRYDGFCKALLKSGLSKEAQVIYNGNLKMELLDSVIEDIITQKVECIVCGDDIICTKVMSRLQAEGYQIPRDIAIASLYNSSNLNCFTPAITAVNVPARTMGNMLGKQMINYLQGKSFQQKTLLDYEILFRKSTNRK